MFKILKNFRILLILTIVVGVFFLFRTSQASNSIIRGAAWWANQDSYLYFNCQDDIMGDRLDVNYNLCGGTATVTNGTCGIAPHAFHFYASPCTSLVHKVLIASNGNFSGQAWNYAQGKVDFEGTTTPDNYSFNSNCPQPLTCDSAHNCIACYNDNNQKVYGWARVENSGAWINLNPATTTPVQLKSWNQASSTSPYYSLDPGDFIGFATTTSSNLSFNCYSAGGSYGCTDYKVYISNLQIGHLSAPNWTYADACTSSALEARLSWTLKSGSSSANSFWPIDYQTAFEVILSTTNSTSSLVFDSGIQLGSASQYVVDKNNFKGFNYNTEYYWWVRLRDQNSVWTPWYQFGGTTEHNGLNDIITNNQGSTHTSPANAKTFKTYRHEFPSPYFTWSPYAVQVASSTKFTSDSQYYTDSNPNLAQNCTGSNCLYQWTTDDSGALISSPTNSTTSITFFTASNTTVNLQVSDTNNYTCSTSTTLLINYGLPIWREVKAQ